jgi:protein-S-isoprenylcysteine O-methyltransferase Ste14
LWIMLGIACAFCAVLVAALFVEERPVRPGR